MNVNIKTELGEITSVVDLSSDDDTPVPSQNNAIANIKPERPRTPETNCSICLEELNNKCYSDSCWHLFCFDCLKRWSTIQAFCPLCKKEFKCIYHTFTDEGLHETYEVRNQLFEYSATSSVFYSNPDSNSIFRMNLFLDFVRRSERQMSDVSTLNEPDHNHNVNYNYNLSALQTFPPPMSFQVSSRNDDIAIYGGRRPTFGQAMRIRVYNENLWADPLPDLSGRYRECSIAFYRNNPAQTYRLHAFILRDLFAIRAVQRTEGDVRSELSINDGHLMSLIMQSISIYDIRDVYIINMLRPFMGNRSSHFVHELYNYAHSPFDMIGYDRNVYYSVRPILPTFYQGLNVSNVFEGTQRTTSPIVIASDPRIFSETIVLDTDDEVANNARLHGQEIIIVSSTNEDDSDVEILSHSYHPLETLDSSRDQPSTSTGIRDSLDRPNNRYNLRRRTLFSPIINDSMTGCPVHLSPMAYQASLRRGMINLDSSSSEDDSFTPIHASQTMRMKNAVVIDKKKRKTKKKKLRKRKRTVDDSRPELRFGSRSRSNSGSSSSFSDTDTRPNNCLPLRTNIVL